MLARALELAWREVLTEPVVQLELERVREPLLAKGRRGHRAESKPACFQAMKRPEWRRWMAWLRGRMLRHRSPASGFRHPVSLRAMGSEKGNQR